MTPRGCATFGRRRRLRRFDVFERDGDVVIATRSPVTSA
jgi:hypothetical protein